MINEILQHNRQFIEEKKYEQYQTSKFPDKKIAVLACMDTRLVELLPAALGFRNGDVKMIKNAGGVISHPFGSVMQSLMIAVYELGVNTILVIGHEDCGVQKLHSNVILRRMREKGIPESTLDTVRQCGVDLDTWLSGFEDVYDSVDETVAHIKNHPLMPADVEIVGFVMDPVTGELKTRK